jgi:hypothetical protein
MPTGVGPRLDLQPPLSALFLFCYPDNWPGPTAITPRLMIATSGNARDDVGCDQPASAVPLTAGRRHLCKLACGAMVGVRRLRKQIGQSAYHSKHRYNGKLHAARVTTARC